MAGTGLIAITFPMAIVSRRLPFWADCITSTGWNERREWLADAGRYICGAQVVPRSLLRSLDGARPGAYPQVVICKAFRMSVEPEHQGEYVRRHNPIWRDLEEALVAHGVHRYSIFLDRQTSDLFAYAEIESEERWAAIATTEVCQRWWRAMHDIMPSNVDGSPVSRDLAEVFHLSVE